MARWKCDWEEREVERIAEEVVAHPRLAWYWHWHRTGGERVNKTLHAPKIDDATAKGDQPDDGGGAGPEGGGSKRDAGGEHRQCLPSMLAARQGGSRNPGTRHLEVPGIRRATAGRRGKGNHEERQNEHP